MNIATLYGGGLETKPLLHVQDLKPGNIAGGHLSHTEYCVQDITTILINEITGASITTRNSSDVAVSSSVVGIHGRQDQPINNPANGTHDEKCYVTLPAGTYVLNLYFAFHNSGVISTGKIYNKTAASDIINFIPYTSYTSFSGRNKYEVKFSLSVQSDIDYREMAETTVNTEDSMGYYGGTGNSNLKNSFMDMMIYKIG